jgi:hypothetical protein
MYKKKRIYVISIISILCVVCVYYIYSAPKASIKSVDINPNEISIISIFNGNTGKKINIDGKDDINRIITNLNDIDFQKDKSSKDYDGFSFSTDFYDLDGNKIDHVTINSKDTIIYNDYFYKDKNSSIDYDFIGSLFDKYNNL